MDGTEAQWMWNEERMGEDKIDIASIDYYSDEEDQRNGTVVRGRYWFRGFLKEPKSHNISTLHVVNLPLLWYIVFS